MVKNVRMRLLLVMQVLTEQTDEKHGLTMKEILEWITEKGIAGERKSVYEYRNLTSHLITNSGLIMVLLSVRSLATIVPRQKIISLTKMSIHIIWMIVCRLD